MAAEENPRTRAPPKERAKADAASQQGRSVGGQGTGPSSDPARRLKHRGANAAQARASCTAGQREADQRREQTTPALSARTYRHPYGTHLAQARHVSADPLPDQARHAPILRANPYPEVTDPICRLPLPTLFYRLEALHLGDLLRIWVRTGATPPRGPLPDFQGPRGRSGHRRNCGALRVPNPISLLEDSRELERSCRKENSSPISRRRLRVLLGYPDEHL